MTCAFGCELASSWIRWCMSPTGVTQQGAHPAPHSRPPFPGPFFPRKPLPSHPRLGGRAFHCKAGWMRNQNNKSRPLRCECPRCPASPLHRQFPSPPPPCVSCCVPLPVPHCSGACQARRFFKVGPRGPGLAPGARGPGFPLYSLKRGGGRGWNSDETASHHPSGFRESYSVLPTCSSFGGLGNLIDLFCPRPSLPRC